MRDEREEMRDAENEVSIQSNIIINRIFADRTMLRLDTLYERIKLAAQKIESLMQLFVEVGICQGASFKESLIAGRVSIGSDLTILPL